jgi:electron transfer flavoprotein beta subunit
MSGLNIVVCVKQVPDSWAEKKLDPTDNTLDRDAADAVVNELDEYAVEEALQIQERLGGADACTVTVLTMGPDKATESIRKALSMGADQAVHVVDAALHGSDALATSRVLAAAVQRLAPQLVILGSESTDARMSVVPAMVAERLGWPQLTFAGKVELDGDTVTVQRQTDYGYDVVSAALPAVVSVIEKINEPRYPSFKGIMAAKKKPVETLSLADLGVSPDDVGLAGAWSAVESFAARPPRQAGTIVKDDGDGAAKAAEYLVAQKFV